MEATTYHPIQTTWRKGIASPFTSSARPMFGMPHWMPAQLGENIEMDPLQKPLSPSRPNQPNNAGTMPNAGRQLAAMKKDLGK